MKVKFTCEKCHESFNVKAENFKNKDSLACPDCGVEFPKDKLKSLGEAVLKIQQVKKSLYEKDELGTDMPTWSVSFFDPTLESSR